MRLPARSTSCARRAETSPFPSPDNPINSTNSALSFHRLLSLFSRIAWRMASNCCKFGVSLSIEPRFSGFKSSAGDFAITPSFTALLKTPLMKKSHSLREELRKPLVLLWSHSSTSEGRISSAALSEVPGQVSRIDFAMPFFLVRLDLDSFS